MKSKTAALILSFAALLAACGTATSPSSSKEPTPTSQTPDSETVDTKMDLSLWNPLIEGLSAGNATVYAEQGSLRARTYYFGEKAYYQESTEGQAGYMVIGEDGIFDFTLDKDGNVVLGEAESPDTSLFSQKKEYFQFPNRAKSFASAADVSVFKSDPDEDGFYQIDVGSAVSKYGFLLLGFSSDHFSYIATCKVQVGEKGASLGLMYTLSIGSQSFSAMGQISEIGTTANQAIEDFQANTKTAPARTAFQADSQAALKKMFGDGALDLIPYPSTSSMVSRADVFYTDEEQTTIDCVSFVDFKSDSREAYAKLLQAAGFTYNANGKDKSGDSCGVAKKVVSEATTEADEVDAVVYLYYVAGDYNLSEFDICREEVTGTKIASSSEGSSSSAQA